MMPSPRPIPIAHAAWVLLPLLVLVGLAAATAAASDTAPAASGAAQACAALDPDPHLQFFGAPLRLSPDLRDADVRLVDVQLGHGECLDSVQAGLARLRLARPQAPALAYLQARFAALAGQGEAAEPGLRVLLAAHPELTSARVLLASILLDKELRGDAENLLVQSLAATPEDLRAAFQLLRVRALNAPRGDGVGKLFTVLRDRKLPPDIRETAAATLLYITALDLGQKEAALREALSFQSQTPTPSKANNLARLLAEESGKYLAARALLQDVLVHPASAAEKDYARLLMAETWLLEAATIDQQPSPANAAQVAKAKSQVAGDMLPLANRIRRWHNLAPLRPFVASVADPDVRDGDGLTALCRAAQALDAGAVRAALAASAKVDGECRGATAVAYVVRAGPGDFPRKQAVLAALLEHGADPDPSLYASSSYTAMSFCADNFPDCERELLPLLRQYKEKWLKPADSPR